MQDALSMQDLLTAELVVERAQAHGKRLKRRDRVPEVQIKHLLIDTPELEVYGLRVVGTDELEVFDRRLCHALVEIQHIRAYLVVPLRRLVLVGVDELLRARVL